MRQAVHPRARGEQTPNTRRSTVPSGSSPRTRGTDVPRYRRVGRGRFIPAHAGNSGCFLRRHRKPPVHPRARGEQRAAALDDGCAGGSSPRTRGTGAVHRPRISQRRFIPAHAGNRRSGSASGGAGSVHPRARGEQSRYQYATALRAGSSPRTRGTVALGLAGGRDDRFIPAHAGNSWARTPAMRSRSVHPRARGEQCPLDCHTPRVPGSSPRTRGTGFARLHQLDLLRFIPAHAGNSRKAFKTRPPKSVHPRARGEQGWLLGQLAVVVGSSPRTRGTEARGDAARHLVRFIPAHAGNRLVPMGADA